MSLSRKKRKENNKKNERSQSFSFDSPSSPTTLMANNNIYPALLSKIARIFKENMVVGTKTKDSIKYHDVFDGREAVVCRKSYFFSKILYSLCLRRIF